MRYEDVQELSYEPKVLEQARARAKKSGQSEDADAPLFDLARVDRLMKGAVDTHIHSTPDAYRTHLWDEAELGIRACEMGMGAVVCKCFSSPTARSARLAQKVVDGWAKGHGKESTKVVGGVVLGYAVGGLNPEAVRCSARIGGKFVWTPGVDSSHNHKMIGQPGGIEVINGDKVVPELREVFSLVTRYDMVLSLCHHNTRERFIMIDDAKEEGVRRIVIVHPLQTWVKMSIDQMKIAASKGAYLELDCEALEPEAFWNERVEMIKEVGADHIVIGTDCGSWKYPPPATQYRAFLCKLLQSGIPEAQLEKIARLNPNKLIWG